MEEKATNKDLMRYIDHFLSGHFGLIRGLPQESFVDFKILHKIKDYAHCVKPVKDFLEIQSVIRVYSVGKKNVIPITREELEKAPARVGTPNPCPIYKTAEFNKLTIPLFLRRWTLLLPAETFLFIISHEMSHILLYSTWSPYRNSEIATDIFSIIITGSKLISQGRKVYSDNYESDVLVGEIEHRFGSLDDEQFEFVCSAIERKRGF